MRIQVIMTEELVSKIDEMATDQGYNRTHVLRQAVNALYEDWSRKQFGYGGIAVAKSTIQRRETRNAQKDGEEKVRTMPAKELIERLKAVGYADPDEMYSSGKHEFMIFDIVDHDSIPKGRYYGEQVVDTKTGIRSSWSTNQTVDQLINALRRQKLLDKI